MRRSTAIPALTVIGIVFFAGAWTMSLCASAVEREPWSLITVYGESKYKIYGEVVTGVFDQKGSTVFCALDDGFIQIIDSRTGQTKAMLPACGNRPVVLDYCHASGFLAVGETKNIIHLWRKKEEWSLEREYKLSDQPTGLRFFAEGKLLAVTDRSGTFTVINVERQSVEKSIATRPHFNLTNLSMRSKGNSVLLCFDEQVDHIPFDDDWKMKESQVLEGITSAASFVGESGKFLALYSGGNLCLADIQGTQLRQISKGDSLVEWFEFDQVSQAVLWKTGELLFLKYLGDGKGDVYSAKVPKALKCYSFGYGADEGEMALCGNFGILTWRFKRDKSVRFPEGNLGPISGVLYSPKDNTLVSSDCRGVICHWPVGKPSPLPLFTERLELPIRGLFPIGKKADHYALVLADGNLKKRKTSGQNDLEILAELHIPVGWVSFNGRPGDWATIADADGYVIAVDTGNGTVKKVIRCSQKEAYSATSTLNGAYIVSGGNLEERELKLIRVSDKSVTDLYKVDRWIYGIESSNVGKGIYWYGDDSNLHIFDVIEKEGNVRLQMSQDISVEAKVICAAISSDGKWIAVGSGESVSIFQSSNAVVPLQKLILKRCPTFVRFNGDGKELYVGLRDTTILAYKLVGEATQGLTTKDRDEKDEEKPQPTEDPKRP